MSLQQLAGELVRGLATPRHPGPEALDFALAVAGADATLAQVLAGPDADALVALLAGPDAELRTALEPLLEGLEHADDRELARLVLAQGPRLRLSGVPQDVELDAQAVADVVGRLRLGGGQHPDVRRALENRLPEADAWKAKALLRQQRHPRHGEAAQFLARAVARLPWPSPDHAGLLVFACRFLASAEADADHCRELARRHVQAGEALAQARRLRQGLATGNVEILLLGGARISNLDEAQWRQEQERLQALSLAACGVPADFGRPAEEDLGEAPALEEMFRRLDG